MYVFLCLYIVICNKERELVKYICILHLKSHCPHVSSTYQCVFKFIYTIDGFSNPGSQFEVPKKCCVHPVSRWVVGKAS